MRIYHFHFPALLLLATAAMAAADFSRDFDITWGADGYHTQISGNGSQMQLLLDRSMGGAFQSKQRFLFGRFDMRLRLVQGDSAGTVTTFYLSSLGDKHDEIDMEFLGNVTGQPYILHTNIYSSGQGDREEQFYLWFDPTAELHSYSVIWTPLRIIFMVDESPIRMYRRSSAVPFPQSQAMNVYGSLWNADDWATRGGLDKTDWSKAPFTALYRDFGREACLPENSANCMVSSSDKWWNQLPQWSSSSSSSPPRGGGSMASNRAVNAALQKLRWVQSKYRVYSYCDDTARFHGSRPRDCPSSP